MKPRRTPSSNVVFRLSGGTEDNDLWIERTTDHAGNRILISVWELTDSERQALVDGANIELAVWGEGTPPVALAVTSEPLGKDGQG